MKNDRFGLRHFLHGILWPLFTHATRLKPTVRHQVRPPRWTRVDVDVTAMDLFGKLQCAVQVSGE